MINKKLNVALLIAGVAMFLPSGINAADIFKGQSTYSQRCAGCHGDRGKGEMPGTPDFARQRGLQKSDTYLVKRLKRGKGSCPPFGGLVKDSDLQNTISYLRTLRR